MVNGLKILLQLLAAFAILSSFHDSHAGAWTLPKGRLWLKSSIYYQSTSSRFCTEQDAKSLSFRDVGCTAAGHSAPFDPFIGGELSALGVFVELVYGTTGWLDLGVQLPFYSLQFTNLSNPNRPRSNNIGDVRFFGKLRLLEEPLIASIKIGAKIPTGSFDIDAEVVNISENQWDFELLGEVSKSLWPLRGFVSLGVGYRIRYDNEDFEHTMGNEFTALLEAGFNITGNLMFKGSFDWLRGQRPRIKSSSTILLWRRELITFMPSILYSPFKNTQLETSVRFPISGRDFPDGLQLIGAVSYNLSLPI